VDRVAVRRGTGQVAEEYLRYLWSEEGQKLGAKYYFRTRQAAIPSWQVKLELVEVDQEFGGWAKAQKTHFDDGALYDKIYSGS
jgi:sulfate/thiosulfate transport system substrate-binding protein